MLVFSVMLLYSGVIEIGDKFGRSRGIILNKCVYYAELVSIFDKLIVLAFRDTTVKRRIHAGHGRILAHKTEIHIIAKLAV